MATDEEPHHVIHDKQNNEFYIKIGEDKAFLQYELTPNDTTKVDLFHTEVPPSFRSKGIGKILAKEALDYFAKEENMKCKLTCSYLQKFVKENRDPSYTKNTFV